jgi:hypothetical protein
LLPRGDETKGNNDYSPIINLDLGQAMGVAAKIILGTAVVMVLALTGYGYLVDLAPAPTPTSKPVVLNAQ